MSEPRARNLVLLRNTLRRVSWATLRRTWAALRVYGIREVAKSLRAKWHGQATQPVEYMTWRAARLPSAAVLAQQREKLFEFAPLVSVIIPVFQTLPRFLEPLLASLRAQTYPNWEACLAGQLDGEARKLLLHATADDPRLRAVELATNEGIAGNTNRAIAAATGQYLAFVDHDDVLEPDALFEVVQALNQPTPRPDLLYTDEDCTDESGTTFSDPHCKPEWSPEMLRSCNYIGHLLVVAASLQQRVGDFRSQFDGSQDHDFLLRCAEAEPVPCRIPKVLYHWRRHADSSAAATVQKHWAFRGGAKAVAEHAKRCGQPARVAYVPSRGIYRMEYTLARRPQVSILIPNRDQAAQLRRCVESIGRSSYREWEILILENGSTEAGTRQLYQKLQKTPGICVHEWPGTSFHFGEVVNFGASRAHGDYVLLLNNDTEALNPNWLQEMLVYAVRADVGCVGAKLLYPNRTVQHAGVVLGIGGIAGHVHRGLPAPALGYFRRAVMPQEFSAVTGACLMTPRTLWNELGGFDPGFRLAYGDIDYCLRLREAGRRVLFTPHAQLIHYESLSRGPEEASTATLRRFEAERTLFRKKWGTLLAAGDPFYNPNLTLETEDFALA